MSTETNVVLRSKPRIRIRTLVQIGMLSAIAAVLMLFKFPLPFAPIFYTVDLSEVPVLVGCFVMGPLAGVVIELVKILLNLVIGGTTTAGVGETANFLIGCALCIPAGILYKRSHTRKNAIIGMAVGVVFMTVIGCLLNAYVLLPVYAKAFGMPIHSLIDMGSAINSSITSLSSFVVLAVAPFNIFKGVLTSVVVFLIYKKISPVFKMRRE